MVDKINRGVESISAAGKSFGEITEGIGKTSDLMRTISSAMEEQRVGARETIQSTASVVEAIQTIQGLSRRQRESTDTMARAVAEIVAAERQIARALQENKEKSSALDASITKVKQSIDGNAEAVANVKRNIAVFNL
jgi:methyl-accepting chemotaxis protein